MLKELSWNSISRRSCVLGRADTLLHATTDELFGTVATLYSDPEQKKFYAYSYCRRARWWWFERRAPSARLCLVSTRASGGRSIRNWKKTEIFRFRFATILWNFFLSFSSCSQLAFIFAFARLIGSCWLGMHIGRCQSSETSIKRRWELFPGKRIARHLAGTERFFPFFSLVQKGIFSVRFVWCDFDMRRKKASVCVCARRRDITISTRQDYNFLIKKNKKNKLSRRRRRKNAIVFAARLLKALWTKLSYAVDCSADRPRKNGF